MYITRTITRLQVLYPLNESLRSDKGDTDNLFIEMGSSCFLFFFLIPIIVMQGLV